MQNSLNGRLWLSKDDQNFLGKGRIELLEQIGKTGSISKAAKAMKMSYKAAWDAVDAMNNLAERALVERTTGGKGGGGTRLTAYGEEIVATYGVLHEEHERFLRNLSLRINEQGGHLRLLDRISMQLSARNQLLGKVIMIHKGSVNSEVVMRLRGDDAITAIITNDALAALDIKIDTEAHAIFKASAVLLTTDLSAQLSTRNRFRGIVRRIERGSVNAEIMIELAGGNTVVSVITLEALDALALTEGSEVLAFCKASHVILGL